MTNVRPLSNVELPLPLSAVSGSTTTRAHTATAKDDWDPTAESNCKRGGEFQYPRHTYQCPTCHTTIHVKYKAQHGQPYLCPMTGCRRIMRFMWTYWYKKPGEGKS